MAAIFFYGHTLAKRAGRPFGEVCAHGAKEGEEVDQAATRVAGWLMRWVDDGLEALISRSAFYDLLNLGYEKQTAAGTCLAVSSRGHEFELGSIDE